VHTEAIVGAADVGASVLPGCCVGDSVAAAHCHESRVLSAI